MIGNVDGLPHGILGISGVEVEILCVDGHPVRTRRDFARYCALRNRRMAIQARETARRYFPELADLPPLKRARETRRVARRLVAAEGESHSALIQAARAETA